jgi:hypothetical protein
MLKHGLLPVSAFLVNAPWADVGTVERLESKRSEVAKAGIFNY